MDHDPTAWARLGKAIRSDRERQSLTREELVRRVQERGGRITTRSIASLETGIVPKKRAKPPTLEPAVAALGWMPGWADRILAGEDPELVLGDRSAALAAQSGPREMALELLTAVYEFSRCAAAAGADVRLRDSFDKLAQQLVASIPVAAGAAAGRSSYGLVAYRPHAPGEGVPEDDAARIYEAMERSE